MAGKAPPGVADVEALYRRHGSKPDDPSCREARSTIAVMAAILLSTHRDPDDDEWAVVRAQSLYDRSVQRVVKRHKQARGKGKGSYPVR